MKREELVVLEKIEETIGRAIVLDNITHIGFLSEGGHITGLALNNQNMSTLPENFSNLRFLKHLNLQNNQFTDIPVEIYTCNQLSEINLAGNPLNETAREILTHPIKKMLDWKRERILSLLIKKSAWGDKDNAAN